MRDAELPPNFSFARALLLGGALLVVILGGAVVARWVSPSQPRMRQQTAAPSQPRAIVQIVRQQPGLPDLADLVDRLCPSVAIVLPRGEDLTPAPNGAGRVRALTYSADGWLVTMASSLAPMPLDAVFGDGRRVQLTEVRSDPVSSLAILKADNASAPLTFNDQAFPRVGQFGLTLATPAGSGCSAATTMIGSDFVADGGSGTGYVRLQPIPDDWAPGTPLLGSDGRVIGIGSAGPEGSLIPAPIASVIIDELVRNSLSATTNFGFRTVDYAAPFSSRLGDVRSGAGVALVEEHSYAEKAGLRAGDIVTAVDERPVSSASELSRLLDAAASNPKLTVYRRSEQIHLTVRRISRS